MWGNITGVVGAAITKAKQLQNELESQLDAAVNADGSEGVGVGGEGTTAPRRKNNQLMLGDYMVDSYEEEAAHEIPSIAAQQTVEGDDDSLTDIPLPESPDKQKSNNNNISVGSSDENQSRLIINQLKEELSISKDETMKYAKLLADETQKSRKLDDNMKSLQKKCEADMNILEKNLNSIKVKMSEKYETEINSLRDEILILKKENNQILEQSKLSDKFKNEIEKLKSALHEKDSEFAKLLKDKNDESDAKIEARDIANRFESEISELKLLLAENEKVYGEKISSSKLTYEKRIEEIHRDHEIALKEAVGSATAAAAASTPASGTHSVPHYMTETDSHTRKVATKAIKQHVHEQHVHEEAHLPHHLPSDGSHSHSSHDSPSGDTTKILHALERERDDLKLRLQELVSSKDESEKKHEDSVALIADLKKRFAVAEDSSKKLTIEMKKKDEEIAGLKKKKKDSSDRKDKGALEGAHKKALDDKDKVIFDRDNSIKDLEGKLEALKGEAEALREASADSAASNVSAASLEETIRAKDELIAKKEEVIAERERALESYSIKMAESHQSVESLQAQLADYKSQLQLSKASINQQAVSSDGDLRKQLLKLQETIRDQNDKLTAFETEGQALAKKQSEMEKVVRQTKKEMKSKETEIAKLKESKEQLSKAIDEMQEVVRSRESDASNASKSFSAMQAVSQASTDKLVKVESDLNGKSEEISNLKRALDTAWSENNDLKRSVVELRADRDDLKRQLGEGTSRVMETESSRRDVEQREAVLRATNKQLQDSLQRQMTDSSAREERLRDEVADMRKRWNDAVANRDNLASELGSATAPLLRQIAALQETMRTKSEAWQSVESTLSERALRAENSAEVAEHKRSLLDEQVGGLKTQLSAAVHKNNEFQSVISNSEFTIERYRKQDTQNIEKISDLESQLSLELGQKSSLQASLRELEMRFKIEQQSSQDTIDKNKKSLENKISLLNLEVENLKEQRAFFEKSNSRSINSSNTSKSPSGDNINIGTSDAIDLGSSSSSSSSSSSGSVSKMKSYLNATLPGTLPSGEASYAAGERLQQQLHHREEEAKSLHTQVSQMQASRDALLDEVSYLSSKNAHLEEQVQALPALSNDYTEARKRTNVLLALLGEKEEEYESLLSDIQEVKFLYRSHIEELLLKITPPEESSV